MKGLRAFTTRALKNFPWTLALMLLNIICLPAGLWLADAGEVTRMLEVLSLYPLQLTPQGYALVPASDGLEAGEWWRLVTPSGVNREYSMYSDANAPHLEFLIRQVAGGTVSPALAAVKPGDSVEIDGPYGEFTLKTPDDTAGSTCSSAPVQVSHLSLVYRDLSRHQL